MLNKHYVLNELHLLFSGCRRLRTIYMRLIEYPTIQSGCDLFPSDSGRQYSHAGDINKALQEVHSPHARSVLCAL